MARASLPPGFRFHPTDIELIMYYLKRKILGKKLHFEAISELNIYKFSPWDLPDKSCLKSKDLEWYFFCPRERKYASGDRMKRGTETGYWKTTGKDRSITYDGRAVGMVKTLVFHEGNAPHGKRTDWVIYEYRMDDKKLADDGVAQDGYVLYKVFKKNGPGPKNGAQYGAPFVEEEWDKDDSVIAIDSLPHNGSSSLVITVSENQNSAASKGLIKPVCTSGLSVVGSGPAVQTSLDEALVDGPTHSMVTDTFDPLVPAGCAVNGQGLSSTRSSNNDFTPMPDDDIAHLLAAFTEDGPSFLNEQGNYELGENSHRKDNIALPRLHGNDSFNGLEDLSNRAELSSGVNFSHDQGHNMNDVLPQDDMAFLELNDLNTPLNFRVESGGFQEVPTGSSYAACDPDASQHLSGSTQQIFSANLGQICSDVNFPSSETVFPRFSQCSMLPRSSGRPEGSTNVYPTGNAYQNIFSQGYTAGYNLHSFSYRQAEEFVDAGNNRERAGVPQRKNFSRLQQMLESFTTVVVHDPASVAHAPSNSAYGGSSSMRVKAEVTLSRCTKDALAAMLEESTYDYSCRWNLHGAEFWKKATADCSNGYGYGCVLFTWTNVGVNPPFFITTTLLLLFLEMFFLCFTCFFTIMNMLILILYFERHSFKRCLLISSCF